MKAKSQKSQQLAKNSGQIRVLIVGDNALARTAWKKVLGKSSQIHIVGESTFQGLATIAKEPIFPEVLVTGFAFIQRDLMNSEKLTKTWGYIPKIIVLCDTKEQIKIAYKLKADWAAAQPFEAQDLITWVRALSDDAKRLCGEYLQQLLTLPTHNEQQKTFFKLAQGCLQLLFHPDLVNPEIATMAGNTDASICHRMVFRNQAPSKRGSEDGDVISRLHEFWEEIRIAHQAKYVPVDVYNASVGPGAIHTIGKYMTGPRGSFGIIIGREVNLKTLHPLTVAQFENDKKVILILDDAAVQEMLEYKAGGINPVCVLQDLYQYLIIKASN